MLLKIFTIHADIYITFDSITCIHICVLIYMYDIKLYIPFCIFPLSLLERTSANTHRCTVPFVIAIVFYLKSHSVCVLLLIFSLLLVQLVLQ